MTGPEAVRQLQRTIGNQRTAALLAGRAPRPVLQRTPLGAVTAIEVVAGLAQSASVVADAYTGTLGELTYSSPTAQRLSEITRPVQHKHRTQCLHLCAPPQAGLTYPPAEALFDVEWEGNDYGEIGAARVVLNQDRSDFFQYSSASVRFDLLNNLIQAGGDKRTWQMQFSYEGSYDTFANGYLSFQGKFAIDAFGNYTSLEHQVRDHGLFGSPTEVHPGPPVTRAIPPVPGDAGEPPPG